MSDPKCEVVEKPSAGQTTDQINQLNCNIQNLEDAVNELCKRLNPVLAEVLPTPGKEEKDRATLVPFAEILYHLNERVFAVVKTTDNAIGRLEL